MNQTSLKQSHSETSSSEPLIERARKILPVISSEAAAGEAAGHLTEKTVAALQSQGLFGLLAPKCYGGLEAGAVEALEIFELISQTDGSTGWVTMAAAVTTAVTAAFLPEAGAESVFGKRLSITAGQGSPRGKAIPDGKGYRVTGKWSYGSGVLHADYLHTGARVYENGVAREAMTCIVPVAQAKILGNWDVIGLRATGSVDYSLEDVYVPKDFTHSADTLVPLRGSEVFKLGIVGVSPLAHGSFALGVGRHMLDELAALAASPDGRPAPLADGTGESFQDGYGIAEGKLRAGRALLYEIYREAEQTIKRGDAISNRQFSVMRLALYHLTAAIMEACTFAYHAGGGVALRNTVLQRCFRDMLAGDQHRIVSNYMLRECSKEMLGLAKGKIWTSYGLIDPPRAPAH